MNEELSYADMLEIPVETVSVNHKEKRRRPHEAEPDLPEQLMERVNDRMEEDPAYAESKPIEREAAVSRKSKTAHRIVIGEFIAVCALCAAIFITNLLMPESAINTFVRGLMSGDSTAADTRSYSDFALSSVVSENADAEITVSDSGVLSFTCECEVYPPCDGKLVSVNGEEGYYSVEIKHSDSFSTIMSGLDTVFCGVGETVKGNLPVAHSGGEHAVHVMFYSNGKLLNCFTLGENGLAWS